MADLPNAPKSSSFDLRKSRPKQKNRNPVLSEEFSSAFHSPESVFSQSQNKPSSSGGRRSGAAALASLDALETAVDSKYTSPWDANWPFPPVYQASFRHKSWEKRRRFMYRALYAAFGATAMTSSFAACGTDHWILRNLAEPEKHKIVESHCKSRFCLQCHRAKCVQVREKLKELLPDGPIRMITLTVRGSGESLSRQMDHLYQSFRRLRQTSLWKKRVLGGVAFLEVKRGTGADYWHPHFHLLYSGRYVAHEALSKQWLICSGDSHVVDIRLVKHRDHVFSYVTKYLFKQTELQSRGTIYAGSAAESLEFRDTVEMMRAMKGRRTIISFGTWRAFKLLAPCKSPDWSLLGSLNEIRYKADQGDDDAISIIQAISQMEPSDEIFYVCSASP